MILVAFARISTQSVMNVCISSRSSWGSCSSVVGSMLEQRLVLSWCHVCVRPRCWPLVKYIAVSSPWSHSRKLCEPSWPHAAYSEPCVFLLAPWKVKTSLLLLCDWVAVTASLSRLRRCIIGRIYYFPPLCFCCKTTLCWESSLGAPKLDQTHKNPENRAQQIIRPSVYNFTDNPTSHQCAWLKENKWTALKSDMCNSFKPHYIVWISESSV